MTFRHGEKDGYLYLANLFSSLQLHLPRWKSLTISAELDTILAVFQTSFNTATQLSGIHATTFGLSAKITEAQAVSLISLLDTANSLHDLYLQTNFQPAITKLIIPKPTTLRNLSPLELRISFTLRSIIRVLSECQSADGSLEDKTHVNGSLPRFPTALLTKPCELLQSSTRVSFLGFHGLSQS